MTEKEPSLLDRELFEVSYYEMDGLPSFVIPFALYERSTMRKDPLRCNEKVLVAFEDASYEGKITRIQRDADLHPWRAIQVVFPDSQTPDFYSPWEIRRSKEAEPAETDKVNQSLQEALVGLIREYLHTPRWNHFVSPVDPDEYPEYLKVVPYPICLEQINARLLSGKWYHSLEAVEWDVSMIKEAASAFNQPSSQIVLEANRLVNSLLMDIRKIDRRQRPSRGVGNKHQASDSLRGSSSSLGSVDEKAPLKRNPSSRKRDKGHKSRKSKRISKRRK